MKTLYFITSNKGKFAEVQERLSAYNIPIQQKNLGYPEVQAEQLEDVAVYGMSYIAQRFSKPFFLEDAGLFIDALGGFPGVYSAYVYYTIGLDGILSLMSNISPDKRTATFRSVIGFKDNDVERLFIGECKGTIGFKQQGSHGFGYDPLFIPTGKTNTFAEMPITEKNQLSHRGNAIQQLIDFLL